MNPVSESIRHIKRSIPKEIIQKAFGRRSGGRFSVSVDSAIRSKIMYEQVIADMDLNGGISMTIDLQGVTPRWYGGDEVIYNIPMDRTDHKRITSAISLSVGSYYGSGAGASPGVTSRSMSSSNVCENSRSDIMNMADRLISSSSLSSIPHLGLTSLSIVGHNTVKASNVSRGVRYRTMEVFVANDEDLSNISPRSVTVISRLSVLAAKSYIYNLLIVEVDENEIHMGRELGVFKRIIEGYSEAEYEYMDYLNNTVAAVQLMNDDTQYGDFMECLIQPIN